VKSVVEFSFPVAFSEKSPINRGNMREEEDAVWALGLMSGTSLDGVDASLLRTDG
jgi:hypothetical protein